MILLVYPMTTKIVMYNLICILIMNYITSLMSTSCLNVTNYFVHVIKTSHVTTKVYVPLQYLFMDGFAWLFCLHP